MSKQKPRPQFRGKQAPAGPDDFQVIDLEWTEPLPEEVLDRPVYRMVGGRLVKVADRARDRMHITEYTEYVPPTDPPAPPPAPKPDEPGA